MAGALHRGRAAASMALAHLLAPADAVTTGRSAGNPSTISRFGTLDDVVRHATHDGAAGRMCALNPDPGDASSVITVVLVSESLTWGLSEGREPIDFTPQKLGELWSRVLGFLGVPDREPVAGG